MIQMLCRNRVTDFNHWRVIFESQTAAASDAGLVLSNMWQNLDDPNNVFFLFNVQDLIAAEAFIHSPLGAEIGRLAGVVDGEYHFISTSYQFDDKHKVVIPCFSRGTLCECSLA